MDAALTDLRAEIEADRERLLLLCAELVEQPSVNPPGDTAGPAAIVYRCLEQHGLAPRVVASVPHMPNVVASCVGSGAGPHLILNVHLDTMEPGDEAAWTVPLFRGTRRDGRVFGLGAGNMKGAVAAMLSAFLALARHRDVWPGRVTLAAVADEVVFGDHGAAHLLSEDLDLVGDGILCGEGPGFMRLGVGEKGLLWIELRASGEGGHASSVEQGRSAVVRMAEAIRAVDGLNGNDIEPPAALAHALPPGHPARHLTVNVGTIQGGTVANQIARLVTAVLDARVPPGLDLHQFEHEVARRVQPFAVGVRRIKGWEANWTDPEHPLARAVRQAATAVRGEPPEDVVRLPASDASRWRA